MGNPERNIPIPKRRTPQTTARKLNTKPIYSHLTPSGRPKSKSANPQSKFLALTLLPIHALPVGASSEADHVGGRPGKLAQNGEQQRQRCGQTLLRPQLLRRQGETPRAVA